MKTSITLKNKDIQMELLMPGAVYTGTRFDHGGNISGIKFMGMELLSKDCINGFDSAAKGQGLYGEFGIKTPVGYDQVQEGELFPKIGTGWLTKNSEPYFFANSYKCQPLEYKIELNNSNTEVCFTCDSGIHNGYGYIYAKKISLTDSGFEINCSLKNSGTQKIETTEYIHNFFNPQAEGNSELEESIGPHLFIQLPWSFDTNRLVENVRTEGLVNIQGANISFFKTPETDFFLGGISQARTTEETNGWWKITDTKHGIEIMEQDDFVPCNCDIWGFEKNLSIELFKDVSVDPGKEIFWKRSYKIVKK